MLQKHRSKNLKTLWVRCDIKITLVESSNIIKTFLNYSI